MHDPPIITVCSSEQIRREGMPMSDYELLSIVLMTDSIIVMIIVAFINSKK